MNLILGCANFCADYGKRLEKDECFRILDRAKELGIETVATAFDYGIDVVNEYGWKDILHKKCGQHLEWGDRIGLSLEEPYFATSIIQYGRTFVMGPFNPLNYSFKCVADRNDFVARSIFCGGKLQRSNQEDVARLVFGFLKSHEVKNAVFGVESIEELELVVRVANEK
jgi:aryl-alcohol dehydrogenase-like predicted oxidoreductase